MFFEYIRKRFVQDERGSIAIVFALTFTAALFVVGGAVDVGRALKIRTQLQAMVDAAVSAGAKALAQSGDHAVAQSQAESFFQQLAAKNGITAVPAPDGTDIASIPIGTAHVAISVSADGTGVSGVAGMNVPPAFLQLIGVRTLPVEAATKAAFAGKELELSLMLDVTGSMDGWSNGSRKIDDLKFAANDLVDIFKNNLSLGATRIALVPFAESVNVGPDLATLVRAYPSYTNRFRRRGRSGRTTYYLTNCVTERNGNHRFTDDPPGPGRWLNPMYSSNGSCRPSQQIVPLTSDENQLRSVINGFQASGATAGHLGTAWSWYLINDRWAHLFAPEAQPKAPDPKKLIKATILMTDGEYNTEYCQGVNDSTINCNSPNGSSKYQAERLCEEMKADGIVVYTVGFGILRNSSQEQLLKNCASDSTKYFFPYNWTELRSAFQEIGRQLSAGQAGIVMKQ